MTRIIAGKLGSLRLAGPAKATRPTSDRVKESVFAKLDALDALDNSIVWDLFAGTGALGLEALSRGAKAVVLVEADRSAAEVCKQNIAKALLGLSKQNAAGTVSLKNVRVEKFLAGQSTKANLVLLDPPYDFEPAGLSSILQALTTLVEEHGLIVLETSSKAKQPELPNGLVLEDTKTYGDTAVWFLTLG